MWSQFFQFVICSHRVRCDICAIHVHIRPPSAIHWSNLSATSYIRTRPSNISHAVSNLSLSQSAGFQEGTHCVCVRCFRHWQTNMPQSYWLGCWTNVPTFTFHFNCLYWWRPASSSSINFASLCLEVKYSTIQLYDPPCIISHLYYTSITGQWFC